MFGVARLLGNLIRPEPPTDDNPRRRDILSVAATSMRGLASRPLPVLDAGRGKRLDRRVTSHTFGGSLLSMRLHSHMGIQVVQGSVRLLASVPTALVHALNLLIATTWPLVLLCSRNGHE